MYMYIFMVSLVESLLVIPAVGVSLRTIYSFGYVSSKFVHIYNVKDIVTVESVTQVYYNDSL